MKTLRDFYGDNALNFLVEEVYSDLDGETVKARVVRKAHNDWLDAVTSSYTVRKNTDYTACAKKTSKPIDFTIEKVIYNYPATIVIWKDGTKTVVKCSENDDYDPEKGLAMAISKKALGNQGNYYNMFTKWLPEEEEGLDIMAEFMNFLVALKRDAAKEEKDGED